MALDNFPQMSTIMVRLCNSRRPPKVEQDAASSPKTHRYMRNGGRSLLFDSKENSESKDSPAFPQLSKDLGEHPERNRPELLNVPDYETI